MKGRKASSAQVAAEVPLDQARVNAAMLVMQADALALREADAQRDATVRAVALQMGYQLPADCTDPDMIQRDISANMRRSVEACMEVGRGLHALRAACENGQFLARLDVLGVEYTVATRFMRAAAKFSKVATSQHLQAIGTQSKLFELLVLGDEQADELILTGQTGELVLDDVATMTVKELRAAVRRTRQVNQEVHAQLSDTNKEMDALKMKLRRIPQTPVDKIEEDLRQEAAQAFYAAEAAVWGNARLALEALEQHAEQAGDAQRHQLFMASMVGSVQAVLTKLRDRFGLPDVSSKMDAQLAADVAAWWDKPASAPAGKVG